MTARLVIAGAKMPARHMFFSFSRLTTDAPQQIASLFDHIIGEREQQRRHGEAKCLGSIVSSCAVVVFETGCEARSLDKRYEIAEQFSKGLPYNKCRWSSR